MVYLIKSEAQREAVSRYKKKFERFELRMQPGTKENIKAAADAFGMSMNAYILRAITEQMRRDKAAPGPSSTREM